MQSTTAMDFKMKIGNAHYLNKAAARLSAFGPSKFVVGSSNASIPQLRQKVSANANLMISEARTCETNVEVLIFLQIHYVYREKVIK